MTTNNAATRVNDVLDPIAANIAASYRRQVSALAATIAGLPWLGPTMPRAGAVAAALDQATHHPLTKMVKGVEHVLWCSRHPGVTFHLPDGNPDWRRMAVRALFLDVMDELVREYGLDHDARGKAA